jgi:hypothetical protein
MQRLLHHRSSGESASSLGRLIGSINAAGTHMTSDEGLNSMKKAVRMINDKKGRHLSKMSVPKPDSLCSKVILINKMLSHQKKDIQKFKQNKSIEFESNSNLADPFSHAFKSASHTSESPSRRYDLMTRPRLIDKKDIFFPNSLIYEMQPI